MAGLSPTPITVVPDGEYTPADYSLQKCGRLRELLVGYLHCDCRERQQLHQKTTIKITMQTIDDNVMVSHGSRIYKLLPN